MKNFLQNYSSISLSLIILILFSLTGSNCEKILENNNPVVTGDIIGNWKLVEQAGALQDICDDETVNFGSAGIAVLTCPNITPITRNYSVANSALTYTQTSVSYNLEFSKDFLTLHLNGIDVSRNLTYQKIVTSEITTGNPEKTDINNSSEQKK